MLTPPSQSHTRGTECEVCWGWVRPLLHGVSHSLSRLLGPGRHYCPPQHHPPLGKDSAGGGDLAPQFVPSSQPRHFLCCGNKTRHATLTALTTLRALLGIIKHVHSSS